jgi:exosortase
MTKTTSQHWLKAAGIAFGLSPLLWTHGAKLLRQPEYQYFPFVLAAAACLLWTRWKEADESQAPRTAVGSAVEVTVLTCSLFLFCAAVHFYNSMFAACAAIWIGAFAVLVLLRYRCVEGIWGVWALLWLCMPIPFYADNVTTSLQRTSSFMSSQLLDLIGINHLMRGNVLHLPNRQLFVDEACSGIVSVMSVVACSAIFAAWKRRPLFHALLLILSGVAAAVLLNVVRIVTIAFAQSVYAVDLASGRVHDVLGLAVFLLTFISVVCTDQLLLFFCAPIHFSAEIAPSSLPPNPIVRVWNAVFDNIRRQVNVVDRSGLSPRPFKIPVTIARAFACVSVVFAVLGVYQFSQILLAGDPGEFTTTTVETINAESLPATVGNWRRTGFRLDKRDQGGFFGYGDSKVFVYENKRTQQTAIISLDYPFPPKWHELTNCYRGAGWQLAERSSRAEMTADGENWSFAVASFDRPSGDCGFLAYCFVDSTGQTISQFLGPYWRLANLRRTNPYSREKPYLQIQVWCESSDQLDDRQRDEALELFHICRERLRDLFMETSS